MAAMKYNMHERKPNVAYDKLRQHAGGICSVRNPSELPRGRKQLYAMKSRANKMTDDVGDLLRYARDRTDLVCYHSDFPEDVWVLGTSAMFSDLNRYTTSDLLSEPFSVDPTFNMGPFEVTAIVYKNLSLQSSRTGEHPICLGPTMIHHRKNYQTYKLFADTVASKCGGHSGVKGFVTDGEKALQKAFEDTFSSAQSLRCFRHFEQNCKEKLKTIGITKRKQRAFFMSELFGGGDKSSGIIDAVNARDLRDRLDNAQQSMEDKEIEFLGRKRTDYKPKFWNYLNDHFDVMSQHMISDIRLKAGMRMGPNGSPLKCYTNISESVNHIMKSERDAFLKQNPAVTQMNKLQFTQHIFETIHKRQREDFFSTLAGVGHEFHLAEHVRYVGIAPDVWFDWPSSSRQQYIRNVDKLSMEDMFKEREVDWPTLSYKAQPEFVKIGIDLAKVLIETFGYPKENALALENEVSLLVNHPHAIKQKATLQAEAGNTYEVASRDGKNQCVTVTLYKDHTTCICGRFKHDFICKHSLAVASLKNVLSDHVRYIQRKTTPSKVTPLAEHDVDKQTAGKKGARNKFPYRKERYVAHETTGGDGDTDMQHGVFTEIHHNNNPFVLEFLHDGAKMCKSCKVEFCTRKKVVPFDVIFAHNERYFFPLKGDWSNKRASAKEATRYYHPTKACLLQRFPYFTVDFVEIPQHIRMALRESHKIYLRKELGLTFDE